MHPRIVEIASIPFRRKGKNEQSLLITYQTVKSRGNCPSKFKSHRDYHITKLNPGFLQFNNIAELLRRFQTQKINK